MPKLNVYTLPRPKRKVETRTFREGEVELELTLRAPDVADMARAAEAAKRLTEDYITGSDLRPEAAPFPEPEVKVSEALFQTVALIAEMQPATDPRERYDAVEFTLLAANLPRTWTKIQRWVGELVADWTDDRKNSPDRTTGSSAG